MELVSLTVPHCSSSPLTFTLISIHGTEQHLQPPDRNTSVGIPQTPPGEPQLQQRVQIQRAKKMIKIEEKKKKKRSKQLNLLNEKQQQPIKEELNTYLCMDCSEIKGLFFWGGRRGIIGNQT